MGGGGRGGGSADSPDEGKVAVVVVVLVERGFLCRHLGRSALLRGHRGGEWGRGGGEYLETRLGGVLDTWRLDTAIDKSN